MGTRKYYSTRTGINPHTRLDLPMLIRLFVAVYDDFCRKDYFVEAFGYQCVDVGDVPGNLGPDIGAAFIRCLRKSHLWPISENASNYSEDDIFDVIEFLFDHISKPIDGRFHDYAGCGMHWDKFDPQQARDEFASEINPLLNDYASGYVISDNGEILHMPEPGFEFLLDASLPEYDEENIDSRVKASIQKFRRARSSFDERRDAIRDLADVLEFLRPQLGRVLTSKDESDLFNIANNFGIRHHNPGQKTNYDRAIWYSWIFYFYLATIHAAIRLIDKSSEADS